MSSQTAELTPEEAMFNEAMTAIQSGDRARARDLLTRLLKIGQNNSEYWVWMSAVVESAKERMFCLKEALRHDPQNAAAKRGLILMGSLAPEASLVVPAHYQKRNWQSKLAMAEGGDQAPGKAMPRAQVALMGLGLLAVLALVAFAFFGVQRQLLSRSSAPMIYRSTGTATLSVSATPTRPKAITGSPMPLWMQLSATYTPTPFYVNTPHSSSEAYRIGLRNFVRQDWKDALTYFAQVATAEPKAPDVQFYLGETYRMQANYPQALQVFNQMVKNSPDFAPGYLGRARVTLAMNPKNVDSALSDIETALLKDPNYGEAYLDKAGLQIQAGEIDQAMATLDQAAGLAPDSPLIFLYRGQAHLALKDTKQALEDARRANQLDMTLLPAYRLIGQALQAEGDLTGSVSPLSTYVLYQADDAQVWSWLAKAHQDQKDTREALKALDQALRLDNRQGEAYLLRAELLLNGGQAQKALDDYKAALRLDSTSFDASLGVGQALMALSYPGDAYMQFERSKGLAKDNHQNAAVYYWRAQSLEKLGTLDVAKRDYQALIALPAGSAEEEWISFARDRLTAMALLTPSPKPKTSTPTATVTYTRQPTKTITLTATRQPTRTPTPSKTAAPKASPTPTR